MASRTRRVVPLRKERALPIFVASQEGVTRNCIDAAIDGAQELITLAKVDSHLKIIDYGHWREEDFKKPDGTLKPYQSIDWYVEDARENSRSGNQINASVIQNTLLCEPWRDPGKGGTPHYDLMLLQEDLYLGDTHFVIGVGTPHLGTTISTFRFKEYDDTAQYELFKTVVMHELGHVFGLIPASRTSNVEYSIGKHCSNTCVMRQGLSVDKWVEHTNDRNKYGALCNECNLDLIDFFYDVPQSGE